MVCGIMTFGSSWKIACIVGSHLNTSPESMSYIYQSTKKSFLQLVPCDFDRLTDAGTSTDIRLDLPLVYPGITRVRPPNHLPV